MLHCSCDSSPFKPAADNIFFVYITDGKSVCLLLLHWKTREETVARLKRWRKAAVAALQLVKPASRWSVWLLLLFPMILQLILWFILWYYCGNTGMIHWRCCSNIGMILGGHSESTAMLPGWYCDDKNANVRILWWCSVMILEFRGLW